MLSVFQVYAANKDALDGRSTTLHLPATPYELLDVLDKARVRDVSELYVEIEEYHRFPQLATLLEGEPDLCQLNALAQKLSELDEWQSVCFEGLVKMAAYKPEPLSIPRLINLAYSTDCCHVVGAALNDSQLGRFYAENGFVPEVESLPDKVFELLDFERIGRERRRAEGGVFVERSTDHTGGYVVQDSELLEVYKGMDLTPKVPQYTILAEASDGRQVEFPFPANAPMRTEPVRCVDCAAPSLIGLSAGMENVDLLSRRLAGMEPRTLTMYKSLLEIADCEDLKSAETLIDSLEEYTFSAQIGSTEEIAQAELNTVISKQDAETLIPHLNMHSYGQALLDRFGGVLTSYGVIERSDGQPVQAMHEPQHQRSGMEMSM